jgi:hypothetical protein
VDGATTHLRLTIETDSEPIAGSVAWPDEEPHRFSGWIELAAAIECARSRFAGPAGCQGSLPSTG